MKFTVNVIFLQTSVLRAMLQAKVEDQKVLLQVVVETEITVAVATKEKTIKVVAEEVLVKAVLVQEEIIEAEILRIEVLVNN